MCTREQKIIQKNASHLLTRAVYARVCRQHAIYYIYLRPLHVGKLRDIHRLFGIILNVVDVARLSVLSSVSLDDVV